MHLSTKIIVFATFCFWLLLLGFIEVTNSGSDDLRLSREMLKREQEKNVLENQHEEKKNINKKDLLEKIKHDDMKINFPNENNSENVKDYVDFPDKRNEKKEDSRELKAKILEKIENLNIEKSRLERLKVDLKLMTKRDFKIQQEKFEIISNQISGAITKPIAESNFDPELNFENIKSDKKPDPSNEIVQPNVNVISPPEGMKEIPGDMGKAVDLPLNLSLSIKELVNEGWRLHEFNQYVSDMIPVKRNLPDFRDEYCRQNGLYLDKLPKTSVIIIFHNEAWSTLLRTVHSVIDRSPDHLIEEIILVDDCSDMCKFSVVDSKNSIKFILF